MLRMLSGCTVYYWNEIKKKHEESGYALSSQMVTTISTHNRTKSVNFYLSFINANGTIQNQVKTVRFARNPFPLNSNNCIKIELFY